MNTPAQVRKSNAPAGRHVNADNQPRAAAPLPMDSQEPISDPVRSHAFEIYQGRCANNAAPGDALSDWLQAERDLRGKPGGADHR